MATTLTRWDPFQQLAQVQQQMDRVWANHTRREPGSWVPSTDIEQTDGAIVFKLDMPSTTTAEISIELHGRTLTISGERRQKREDGHEGFLSRERAFGKFSRSFLMPEDITEEDIVATFVDGELKVTVPRPTVETPHRIEITNS